MLSLFPLMKVTQQNLVKFAPGFSLCCGWPPHNCSPVWQLICEMNTKQPKWKSQQPNGPEPLVPSFLFGVVVGVSGQIYPTHTSIWCPSLGSNCTVQYLPLITSLPRAALYLSIHGWFRIKQFTTNWGRDVGDCCTSKTQFPSLWRTSFPLKMITVRTNACRKASKSRM